MSFLFSKGLMIEDAYDMLFFMNSYIAGFGSAGGSGFFCLTAVCLCLSYAAWMRVD